VLNTEAPSSSFKTEIHAKNKNHENNNNTETHNYQAQLSLENTSMTKAKGFKNREAGKIRVQEVLRRACVLVRTGGVHRATRPADGAAARSRWRLRVRCTRSARGKADEVRREHKRKLEKQSFFVTAKTRHTHNKNNPKKKLRRLVFFGTAVESAHDGRWREGAEERGMRSQTPPQGPPELGKHLQLGGGQQEGGKGRAELNPL